MERSAFNNRFQPTVKSVIFLLRQKKRPFLRRLKRALCKRRFKMALVKDSKLRKDFGISSEDLKAIKNFLQGAVYCWVKNRKDEFFAARDLMGGDNFNWHGTPLYCLYEKHSIKGSASLIYNSLCCIL